MQERNDLQLLETRESLRLLVFPGTEVLHKVLLPNAAPYPPPPRADKAQHATTADAKTTPAEIEGRAPVHNGALKRVGSLRTYVRSLYEMRLGRLDLRFDRGPRMVMPWPPLMKPALPSHTRSLSGMPKPLQRSSFLSVECTS